MPQHAARLCQSLHVLQGAHNGSCWYVLNQACPQAAACRCTLTVTACPAGGAPWVWLVCAEVVHLRDVHQLDLHTRQGRTHVADGGVICACDGDGAAGLCDDTAAAEAEAATRTGGVV